MTCSGNANNCTACLRSGNLPNLLNGQCSNSCPSGTVANTTTLVCQTCTNNCATCVTTPSQCVTCKSGYLLYGAQCVATCPPSYTSNGKSCIGCDPKCQSCSPTQATQCLQCLKPLILLNNVCITACPTGYEPDSNGVQCFAKVNNTGGGGVGGSGSGTIAPEYTSNTSPVKVYGSTQIA